MAEKIATYQAKELALRPTNAGYEAAQMAGRRIGPFAEAAARAVKEVADLSGAVEKDLGVQQTAFARFEGLESRETARNIRYGGGLKDMFQLGAGGNEPDYARLNRLAELQDGPVRISAAARRAVRAQSPLTHDLTPAQAWQKIQSGEGLTDKEWQEYDAATGRHLKKNDYVGINTDPKTGGVAPNPDVTPGSIKKSFESNEEQQRSQGVLEQQGFKFTGGEGSDTIPGYPTTQEIPRTSTGGYPGFGGDEPAGPDATTWGIRNDNPTLNWIGTMGGLWPRDTGAPPDTGTSQVPSGVPSNPADNPAAPPYWGDVMGGL